MSLFGSQNRGEVLGTITAATHAKEICLSLGGKKISARGFNQKGRKVENFKIFEFQQKPSPLMLPLSFMLTYRAVDERATQLYSCVVVVYVHKCVYVCVCVSEQQGPGTSGNLVDHVMPLSARESRGVEEIGTHKCEEEVGRWMHRPK